MEAEEVRDGLKRLVWMEDQNRLHVLTVEPPPGHRINLPFGSTMASYLIAGTDVRKHCSRSASRKRWVITHEWGDKSAQANVWIEGLDDATLFRTAGFGTRI